MTRNRLFALLAVAILLPATTVAADELANVSNEDDYAPAPYQQIMVPTFEMPGLVQVYAVECSAQGGVKVRIKDCCVPGDRWEVLAKLADQKPAVGMLTGNGSTTAWRSTVLDGKNEAPLRTLIQLRYCHGVNDFPASAILDISCTNAEAVLTVIDLGQFPDISK